MDTMIEDKREPDADARFEPGNREHVGRQARQGGTKTVAQQGPLAAPGRRTTLHLKEHGGDAHTRSWVKQEFPQAELIGFELVDPKANFRRTQGPYNDNPG
jgi:hypothetical protein